ncbi:MAG: hypothetical protein MK212_12030, partial [Saprospiraceae bacterium]|nr:hypothetical protein [Saprospiraceae bacterium]
MSVNIILTLILSLFLSQLSYAQPALKATKTEALLSFEVFDSVSLEPVHKDLMLTTPSEEEDNKVDFYRVHVDKNGKGQLLIPVGKTYSIHLKGIPDYATLEIGDRAYQKHTIRLPFREPQTVTGATASLVSLQLQLIDIDGMANPLVERIQLMDIRTKIVYKTITDNAGEAWIKLPKGRNFLVSLDGAPNYYLLRLENEKYLTHQQQIYFERKKGYDLYPSVNTGIINFIFKNMEGNPTAGQAFFAENTMTGEVLQCITNEYGVGQLSVPLENVYLLSTLFNPHFTELPVYLQPNNDLFIQDIIYQAPTEETIKARIREKEILAAKRDAENRRIAAETARALDSLEKLDRKLWESELEKVTNVNKTIPLDQDPEIVKRVIESKATMFKKLLKDNPTYAKDSEKPILSTFQRMKESWKDKVIVTDITQSMQPYNQEVLVWHALNLIQSNNSRYAFFNDGDNKICSAKKIGQTDGVYFAEGRFEDLATIINSMQTAMQN